MASEARPKEESANDDHNGLYRQLPENHVEYLCFIIDPNPDARNQLAQLETIRQSASKLSGSLTKDYIWQKDEFSLETRNEQGKLQA